MLLQRYAAASSTDDDLSEKDMLRELLIKMNIISPEILEIKQSVKCVNVKVERHEKMSVEMRREMDDSAKDLCCVRETVENAEGPTCGPATSVRPTTTTGPATLVRPTTRLHFCDNTF